MKARCICVAVCLVHNCCRSWPKCSRNAYCLLSAANTVQRAQSITEERHSHVPCRKTLPPKKETKGATEEMTTSRKCTLIMKYRMQQKCRGERAILNVCAINPSLSFFVISLRCLLHSLFVQIFFLYIFSIFFSTLSCCYIFLVLISTFFGVHT